MALNYHCPATFVAMLQHTWVKWPVFYKIYRHAIYPSSSTYPSWVTWDNRTRSKPQTSFSQQHISSHAGEVICRVYKIHSPFSEFWVFWGVTFQWDRTRKPLKRGTKVASWSDAQTTTTHSFWYGEVVILFWAPPKWRRSTPLSKAESSHLTRGH